MRYLIFVTFLIGCSETDIHSGAADEESDSGFDESTEFEFETEQAHSETDTHVPVEIDTDMDTLVEADTSAPTDTVSESETSTETETSTEAETDTYRDRVRILESDEAYSDRCGPDEQTYFDYDFNEMCCAANLSSGTYCVPEYTAFISGPEGQPPDGYPLGSFSVEYYSQVFADHECTTQLAVSIIRSDEKPSYAIRKNGEYQDVFILGYQSQGNYYLDVQPGGVATCRSLVRDPVYEYWIIGPMADPSMFSII